MATTILQALSGLLTPGVIDDVGAKLGESPGALTKGFSATLPALLAGLGDQTSDPRSLERLFGLINHPAAANAAVLRDPAGALGADGRVAGPLGDLGGQLLAALFGDRSGALASALANFAGLKGSSASSLLSLAAPLVLAYFGDRTRREGLGASGLASLLAGERSSIASALPASLSSVLPSAGRASAAATAAATQAGAGGRRLWPIVLAALALLGLWALLRGRPEAPPSVSAPPPAAFIDRTLPNGTRLNAPGNGIEMQLVGFLEDSSRGVDETTWFDFDRLLFETGSATLEPESREQLRNVAEILKAYPSVQLKLGGYTDNQGDPASNLKLSSARATSVTTELVALGIAPGRLSAEGYGEAHPVADNSTEQGRAKNRRIALLVTQK